MPRRSGVPKREVLPDPVYNSTVVTKVVNQIMLDGKKGIAQEIVYGAFDTIKEKMNLDPMEVFNQAINNIMPVLEVKARRVGGSNYQVPMEIRPDRRQTLAIRWLVLYARKRSEKQMYLRLAGVRAEPSKRRKTCTKWRKPTKRLHIIVGNGRKDRWQEHILCARCVTSESWRTSTREKLRQAKESCFSPAKPES